MTNVNLYNAGLFTSNNTLNDIQTIDLSTLLSAGAGGTTPVNTKPDPRRLAPWDTRVPTPSLPKIAADALKSSKLVDPNLGKGPGSGITDANDKDLFVLHNATQKLKALADAAAKDGISAETRKKIQERIEKGLAELEAYVRGTKLEGALLIGGRRLAKHESEGLAKGVTQIDTKTLAKGDENVVPEGFEGDRKFKITVTLNANSNTPIVKTINIDLAEMGDTKRTITNVASFINKKLENEKVETRLSRVETKVPSKTTGGEPTIEQRLRITLGSLEKVSFDAVSGDTQTALYVAGGKNADVIEKGKVVSSSIQSLISRLTDLTGTSGKTQFNTDLAASSASKDKTASARASVVGPDGSLYVIADATAKTNGQTPKSTSDVVLIKYTTTGEVAWTRSLGSAAPAQGFSVAVGADGTIAVAGAVTGKADRLVTTTGDKMDTFVAAFDADGKDKWYHQQGAMGDDKATQVKVGDDGSVYIMGTTTYEYGGALAKGGKDVFLQAIGTDGKVRFTKSLGSEGDDTPAGLVLQDGKAVAIWNQSDGPRMSKFDVNTGDESGTTSNLSSSNLSYITHVATDSSGRIFLAGARETGGVANKLVAMNLSTEAVLYTKETSGEPIRALTTGGGKVAYVSTVIDTDSEGKTKTSAVVGLDAETGTEAFNKKVEQLTTTPISIALSDGVSKSLEAMGIPQGTIAYGEGETLTDKTGLRAGDQFSIIINGKKETKITIDQGETFRSLAAKLNRIIMSNGTAEARSLKGVESIAITPKARIQIELKATAGVADALTQLGLEPGVAIARPAKAGTKSVNDPPPIIAMEIPTEVDVSDKAKAAALADSFEGVMRRIRIGYREISNDPTQVELRKQNAIKAAMNSNKSSAGSVAYYNKQTALAKDALKRLGVTV
ncbi:hypothetical protein [Candidatus Phycosocius spiralis]|nr:hypothetical protein [Candidatus Phycosocius spiralis]